MPCDTKSVMPNPLQTCANRSLLLDRFADPHAKEDGRKSFFAGAIGKPFLRCKKDSWQLFLQSALNLKPEELIVGKSQARLMVNMAGGVMENAGLCLDRLSGIPFIPGSAIKGCARRMAIQEVLELTELDGKAKHLESLALVFGWGDAEWKDGRAKDKKTGKNKGLYSDFEYACGEGKPWEMVRAKVSQELAIRLKIKAKDAMPVWKQLPAYAGLASFLPAYPQSSPLPDLELDVLTCHHPDYYRGELEMPVALDTESPVPVVFPALAPGHLFCFAVIGRDQKLVAQARSWLRNGLQIFGIGAKTAAGYGWFDCAESATNELAASIDKEIEVKKHQPAGDFNEIIFSNAVLKRLVKKGEWGQLQKEIEKLAKPQNKEWLSKFLQATTGKEHKDLRAKDWYPK